MARPTGRLRLPARGAAETEALARGRCRLSGAAPAPEPHAGGARASARDLPPDAPDRLGGFPSTPRSHCSAMATTKENNMADTVPVIDISGFQDDGDLAM